MSELTREQMEVAINRGFSVMLNTGSVATVATTLKELPTAAQLAKRTADPDKIKGAEDVLDAQIKALQDAKQALHAPVVAAAPVVAGQPTTPLELAAQAKMKEQQAEELQRERVAIIARDKALADQKTAAADTQAKASAAQKAAGEKANIERAAQLKAEADAAAKAAAKKLG